MTPMTRPSSSTRTTGFDVGLDWCYRGRSRDVHRVIGSRSKRLEEEWPWQMSREQSKRLRAELAEGLEYHPASLAAEDVVCYREQIAKRNA
jgi:hypothetical protein